MSRYGYGYLNDRIENVFFYSFCFPAPERKISVISNITLQQEQNAKSNDTTSCSTPTGSPGPSRINRVLTPVNQVTPIFKRFIDSAGNINK